MVHLDRHGSTGNCVFLAHTRYDVKIYQDASLSIVVRWLIIIVVSIGVARVYGREHGRGRWWVSVIGHLGVFSFGVGH